MFRKLMAARQAMLTTRNQSVRQFSAYAQHRNTEDNTEETPFEFTPESHAAIEQLLTKYPDNYKCSAVIPALFIAQKQNSNFLTLTAMHKVAKMLEMTPMQVCGTTPCLLRGAQDIIRAVKDFSNIEEGETSADGLFTLQEVECLGACANAPMIQVNNEWFYEDLTYDSMQAMMTKWKNGEEPKKGPQNDRINSLGIEGRTSLYNIPQDGDAKIDRDFAGELQRYNDAAAAAAAARAAAAAAKK